MDKDSESTFHIESLPENHAKRLNLGFKISDLSEAKKEPDPVLLPLRPLHAFQ